MKTAKETLKKHTEGIYVLPAGKNMDALRTGILEAMEIYADQFKPKWISVDTELPEFIPGVEGYGMNTYKVLVLGMDEYQLMNFKDGKWFWRDGIPEFEVMHWLKYDLPEKPE